MLTWVGIILKALGLINTVLTFAKDERMRGLGAKEALASGLDAARVGVEIATKARDRVREELTKDPTKIREDDGFRR